MANELGRSHPHNHAAPATEKDISKPITRGRLAARVILGLIGLAYFATSAIVVVNGFVWLPPLPSPWYRMQDILYWPFQPYFDLTLHVLGSPDIPYGIYALGTRIPFLALGFGLLKVALRHAR